ncbi:MFS transporter [Streptomyces sp. NPDC005438]|uniref:MFS transporter n=1 Tax=Streptomyces sp. NPDC005438 TaxID=3156880 RepID=UPI0033BAA439
MLLYPLYALLFADVGLSEAQISSLFLVWSLTGVLLEVPSGVWADVFSRRRLVTLAPLLKATGFALWTWWPSYGAFLAGFVLWGAGSALRSGTLQALVYAELARLGRSGSYARLVGRAEAGGDLAILLATGLAGPVFALAGYPAVGALSVLVCLGAALVASGLPDHRHHPPSGRAPADATSDEPPEAAPRETSTGMKEVWRRGVDAARRSPALRRALLLVSVLAAVDALDEYLPLLARSFGVDVARVPALLLLVSVGGLVGSWCAEYGQHRAPWLLVAGAASLALGALSGHPAGMVLVAVAFGIFQWAAVVADARLQDAVDDRARATLGSFAGLGTETVSLLIIGGFTLGALWTGPGPLMALCALPYGLLALRWATARRSP